MSEVDSLIDRFPHPIIGAHIGPPTYPVIAAINQKLNANAASVFSNLGNGLLGHLALTVTPAQYEELAGVAFEVPINPGIEPELGANPTGPIIAAAERRHTDRLKVWRTYTNTDKALKQQLLAAIHDMYCKAVKHRITGYANVSTRGLLDHLYSVYGTISEADLLENDANMKRPFDVTLPIEQLWCQIEDGIDLATAAESPYSDKQVVTIAYTNLYNTGALVEACREWRRTPTAEQTWDNFKAAFALAHQEYRESNTTTQQGGYHANHAQLMMPPQPPQYMPPQYAPYMHQPPPYYYDNGPPPFNHDHGPPPHYQQYANSMQENQPPMYAQNCNGPPPDQALLSQQSTSPSLVSALTETTNKLNAALADIEALKTANKHGRRKDTRRGNPSYKNENYCWTHGYLVADNHTSATCKKPKEGHQKEATRANTMNGSQANK